MNVERLSEEGFIAWKGQGYRDGTSACYSLSSSFILWEGGMLKGRKDILHINSDAQIWKLMSYTELGP